MGVFRSVVEGTPPMQSEPGQVAGRLACPRGHGALGVRAGVSVQGSGVCVRRSPLQRARRRVTRDVHMRALAQRRALLGPVEGGVMPAPPQSTQAGDHCSDHGGRAAVDTAAMSRSGTLPLTAGQSNPTEASDAVLNGALNVRPLVSSHHHCRRPIPGVSANSNNTSRVTRCRVTTPPASGLTGRPLARARTTRRAPRPRDRPRRSPRTRMSRSSGARPTSGPPARRRRSRQRHHETGDHDEHDDEEHRQPGRGEPHAVGTSALVHSTSTSKLWRLVKRCGPSGSRASWPGTRLQSTGRGER